MTNLTTRFFLNCQTPRILHVAKFAAQSSMKMYSSNVLKSKPVKTITTMTNREEDIKTYVANLMEALLDHAKRTEAMIGKIKNKLEKIDVGESNFPEKEELADLISTTSSAMVTAVFFYSSVSRVLSSATPALSLANKYCIHLSS